MNFSVLMSLYYRESPNYLEQCLLSLYEQTLSIPEIVCVFDGPITEDLERVVDSWSHKLPIKIIRLEKNLGLGSALNEGLNHCSFDIVARMDTDDICAKTRFEEQINFLSNNPDVKLLGSNIYEFEDDISNITSSRKVPTNNNDIVEFAKKKNPFNHMSVIFRKDAIIKVGGYKHHHLMEDYNLWLRVLADGNQGANLKDCLVLVRAGGSMISRRRGLDYINSELQLAKLKYNLNIQSYFQACLVFIIRSIPRLLPVSILSYIYKFSRR